MGAPNSTVDQNLLPVQAYFDVYGNFQTFIGQGKAFTATISPIQSGLTITNSTLDSSPIGSTSPSTGVFTSISTTTGTISTQPSSANDIVNLLALQSYAAGISWKQPCACATLANITLLGLQTIDGYTTLSGDRVLVKNQTSDSGGEKDGKEFWGFYFESKSGEGNNVTLTEDGKVTVSRDVYNETTGHISSATNAFKNWSVKFIEAKKPTRKLRK